MNIMTGWVRIIFFDFHNWTLECYVYPGAQRLRLHQRKNSRQLKVIAPEITWCVIIRLKVESSSHFMDYCTVGSCDFTFVWAVELFVSILCSFPGGERLGEPVCKGTVLVFNILSAGYELLEHICRYMTWSVREQSIVTLLFAAVE